MLLKGGEGLTIINACWTQDSTLPISTVLRCTPKPDIIIIFIKFQNCCSEPLILSESSENWQHQLYLEAS